MFSNSYVVWRVHRECDRDRLREAEQYRLATQARLAHGRRGPHIRRALSWFGQRLVQWGSHLQERYAAMVDPSPLGAINHHR
jgi:hypothetical protein